MPNIITMTYDGYPVSPVPVISINKEYQKTADSTSLGTLFKVNLNGTIYAESGGLSSIMAKQDEIRAAFDEDGKLFQIMCDGSPLLTCYPRINSIVFNESPNNWVITCPFTIDLEFDEEPAPTGSFTYGGENTGLMPPFVSSADENWQIEFADENSYYNLGGSDYNSVRLRLTHTISAVGKRRYTGSGLEKAAWEQARDYVLPNLGYNSTFAGGSGVLNITVANFSGYNHMRSNSIDAKAGSYSVTENWILTSGDKAIEDFTVEVRKGIDSDLTSVSIQGSIQGLETRVYGTAPGQFSITQSKFAAASGYWATTASTRVLTRAQTFATASSATRPLNSMVVSRSVGYNPPNGSVTYNYEYNDRPSNCVANSFIENISVSDTNPADVFAEIPILGRSAGPILQDMGTVTSRKRNVSVDVVMAPSTGCTTTLFNTTNPSGDVNTIIQYFYAELTGSYGQVFKSADSSTWEPKTGRYTRQVEWTIGNCS